MIWNWWLGQWETPRTSGIWVLGFVDCLNVGLDGIAYCQGLLLEVDSFIFLFHSGVLP